MGAVTVRQSRVSDVSAGVEPFQAELLGRW